MGAINEFFDRVVIINLDRRPDRWADCKAQLEHLGVTKYERFSAFDGDTIATDLPDGINVNTVGNSPALFACTCSHRAVLDAVAVNRWQRTLILEDDFLIRDDDCDAKFGQMMPMVPADWELLYLAGHYAEKPQYRVNEHVIRINRMICLTAYAVTLDFARRIAPYMSGYPADCLFYGWNMARKCYIFQPRLMVQAAGFSDIQKREMDNRGCMSDTRHEEMV